MYNYISEQHAVDKPQIRQPTAVTSLLGVSAEPPQRGARSTADCRLTTGEGNRFDRHLRRYCLRSRPEAWPPATTGAEVTAVTPPRRVSTRTGPSKGSVNRIPTGRHGELRSARAVREGKEITLSRLVRDERSPGDPHSSGQIPEVLGSAVSRSSRQ